MHVNGSEAIPIVTRKEVANRAGVSEATVSRVLNGIGPMKEQTRLRVLEAVRELNYQPNEIARSFASRRSNNLGVILPYLPNVRLFSTYYFSEILSGIGSKVREFGYDLLLVYRKLDEPIDFARLHRSQKVDACILLGMKDVPEELEALLRLQEQGMAFALVNQRFRGHRFNEVDADHVQGSREAVMHLLSRGYSRIALLNGPEAYSNSRDRLEGYVSALSESGAARDAELRFEGNYGRTSGYQLAGRIGHGIREGRIDAVFAANDRMAIGLIQGLREMRLVAGIDYGIVGYDDSDAARWMDPPLTSVHVPFFDMGEKAAEMLLGRLADPGGNEEGFRVNMQPSLNIRASSNHI